MSTISRRTLLAMPLATLSAQIQPSQGALAGNRLRVLVSSDIGGTDPDDFQSLVHLLLYADILEVEGLVSSPYGPGRARHILEVLAEYEKDYPALYAHSKRYPKPDALRALTKQGALDSPGYAAVGAPTEGSQWIVQCAKKIDPRPLHLLVWGGIEDLAQALHDAPEILPKLRVYFIGGPNKMWSVDAFQYIETDHPNLWIIESNATYRGWFTGGRQDGVWGNSAFVAQRLASHGHLGNYFATHLKGVIKMGDTPSVGRLLRGAPEDPSQASWGGRFVRAADRPKFRFQRLTTPADPVDTFGVAEFAIPAPAGLPPNPQAQVLLDNRIPSPIAFHDGKLHFRFCPKEARIWSYAIESNLPALNGMAGKFTARPLPTAPNTPSQRHPNWWVDDPDPALAEGVHQGAKSVSQWRQQFLEDFAQRIERTDRKR